MGNQVSKLSGSIAIKSIHAAYITSESFIPAEFRMMPLLFIFLVQQCLQPMREHVAYISIKGVRFLKHQASQRSIQVRWPHQFSGNEAQVCGTSI
ncbi:hypothetical protein D0N36_14280 [Hymenobacter lapidiphilus]|nr:hypothetical protein D0N36_14280 [Hymenobacter sp. CCM 8763]